MIAILAAGCDSAGNLYHDPGYREREVLKTSLIKDEKAVLSWIEFCLVDVKTGAIPFADTFEDIHTELQIASDDRIAETQRRGEKAGTLTVLGKAAEATKAFIGRR